MAQKLLLQPCALGWAILTLNAYSGRLGQLPGSGKYSLPTRSVFRLQRHDIIPVSSPAEPIGTTIKAIRARDAVALLDSAPNGPGR